jgi:hypothetical protein
MCIDWTRIGCYTDPREKYIPKVENEMKVALMREQRPDEIRSRISGMFVFEMGFWKLYAVHRLKRRILKHVKKVPVSPKEDRYLSIFDFWVSGSKIWVEHPENMSKSEIETFKAIFEGVS